LFQSDIGFIGVGVGAVWGMMYVSLFAIPIVLLIALFKIGMAIQNHFKRKNNGPDSQDLSSPETTKQIKNSSNIQFKIHWVVTTILPALFVIAITLMYLRARIGIGHWPEYMIDDPKGLLPDDNIYTWLFNTTLLAMGFAGWSVFLWIGFFVAWYNKYSPRQRKIMLWTFILVWILVLFTTGNTFSWLMD
jgi:hypothetical protein